ncbi:hypothetical protein [Polaromonas aquatica]|uniref:Uncharacterized protein n=1 Tax=Polaromonas aquatica TaxID=332657 RepID=A0ABW1U6S3_9BURK
MQALQGPAMAREAMKLQGFHQGLTPTKIVNTYVDDEKFVFDNCTHGVKISRAIECGSGDAQCVLSIAR